MVIKNLISELNNGLDIMKNKMEELENRWGNHL